AAILLGTEKANLSLLRNTTCAWLGVWLIAACCTAAPGQTSPSDFDDSLMAVVPDNAPGSASLDPLPDNPPHTNTDRGSLIGRSARRVLHDQGELYTAPL